MSPNIIHGALASIILLVVTNIVLLNVLIFSRVEESGATAPTPTTSQRIVCDETCKKYIRDEVKKLQPTVTNREEVVEPTIAPVIYTEPSQASNQPLEFIVTLGGGITKKNEYEDLYATEVAIDTNNYPQIEAVYFEVLMHIPTGNGEMFAKLVNATDKHDVWFSEVSVRGGDFATLQSKITLEPGRKKYRVAARSTLSYDAVVDNARIRIITR